MSGYRFVQWIAVHRFGVVALLGAVAVCPIDPRIANAQTAFPSCTFDSSAGGYQCTIAAGSYTQPVEVTQGALTVTNSGTFTFTGVPSGGYGLNFFAAGANGASSDSSNGTSGNGSGYINGINQGAITLNANGQTGVNFRLLDIQALGGNGGDGEGDKGKYSGGAGGLAGGVYVENHNPIVITSSGNNLDGFSGVALRGFSLGGTGGTSQSTDTDGNNVPKYDGGVGGAGGGGGGVGMNSYATVTAGSAVAPITGTLGFQALEVRSQAGAPGTGGTGIAGSAAGAVSVDIYDSVQVFWNWGSGATVATGLFGVQAASIASTGTQSVTPGVNGGAGGAASSATIRTHNAITFQVSGSNAPDPTTVSSPTAELPRVLPNPLYGAAMAAYSLGGAGGNAFTSSVAGAGGNAGTATIQVNNATVAANGDYLAGLVAASVGGAGGRGTTYFGGGVGGTEQQSSSGGAGGAASGVSVAITQNSATTSVSTTGTGSAGIVAASLGGDGGVGTDYEPPGGGLADGSGGSGGNGGAGGTVQVTTSGHVTISTQGDQAPAILAVSDGGNAGSGGSLESGVYDNEPTGDGGGAGAGAAVTVAIGSGTAITTSGTASAGITALSVGGLGGNGGDVILDVAAQGRNGGAGGNSGNIQIQLGSQSSITTSGTNAHGIVAISQSGGGGLGGNATGGLGGSESGIGGAGGSTGTVQVNNLGSITTTGSGARGILAMAQSGGGGDAGTATGVFFAGGASGSSSGTVGTVTVVNQGTISTAGSGAHGIAALSIAGGGGAGGAAQEGLVSLGGSSDTVITSNGGAVTVNHSGRISTGGSLGVGILAQSIGGGGGDAGDSTGVITIGGNGGGGGAGGNTTVNMTGGTITTAGQLGFGAVVQSVGGGGGLGGNATGVSLGVALANGGTGGSGGNGGTASFVGTGGTILTQQTKAPGVIVQSVGGGGGAGGAAYSFAGGLEFSAAVAMGGTGGNGGSGGVASATLSNITVLTGQAPSLAQGLTNGVPTNLSPVDAFGVLVQSIGGGGGVGGSASANALAVAVPLPTLGFEGSLAVSTSIGGTGGDGGSPTSATATLGANAIVTTQGQGSHGVVVQSIGRGGGVGGDSSAMAATIAYGRASTAQSTTAVLTLDVTVAVGGSGGSGGAGAPASIILGDPTGSAPSAVSTFGDYANGIMAQSIGGGGGDGGFGSTSTQNYGGTWTVTAGVGVGGSGSTGAVGGDATITVNPTGSVSTYGAGAPAIVAQSIGGGGGTSQGGAIDLGGTMQFPAQGGGPVKTFSPGATVDVAVGGDDVNGGNGGTVLVTMAGTVRTQGGGSAGIVAQSIGGGGGIGGAAGGEASADNPVTSTLSGVREFISNLGERNQPYSYTYSTTVAGSGATGSVGGGVTVNQSGTVTTLGDWSPGIVAQSIGGGGGMASTAAGLSTGVTATLSHSVGMNPTKPGQTGTNGNGGTVTVNLTNGAISTGWANYTQGLFQGLTTGYGAFGVVAQSIGGGGGIGVDGSNNSTGTFIVGSFESGGTAGDVTFNATSTGQAAITTIGYGAHGVVLQSIAGGGGIGGAGSSTFDPTTQTAGAISLQMGTNLSSSAQSGTVTVNAAGLKVTTTGNNAYGILAQSIGGGGGLGFALPGSLQTMPVLGRTVSPAMTGGAVNITLGLGGTHNSIATDIKTSGAGAHGVVAQSIGGGGGIGGYTSGTPTLSTTPAAVTSNPGIGGAVTVLQSNGQILTTGAGAHGIVAQSIGTSGGLIGFGSTLYAGATGNSYNDGVQYSGAVTVTANGGVNVSGENSIAIFAQSIGALGTTSGSAPVTVNTNFILKGGSGAQGAAIWVADGVYNGTQKNTINILGGASISALSGVAVNYSGNASVDLYVPSGTVFGSVNLGPQGQYITGGTLFAGSSIGAARLVNSGQVFVGTAGSIDRTTLTGDFVQTGTGTLVIDADFGGRRSDSLTVQGSAILAGQVRTSILDSVLPNVAIPFMTVQSSASGTLAAEASALFGYSVTRSGNQYLLAATSADFVPAGFNMPQSQVAVAEHLQAIWDRGGSPVLGPLFALLNTAATSGEAAYAAQLRQLSPNSTYAPGARGHGSAGAFANNAMSCPEFSGTTAMLVEGQCGWMRVTGRTTSQETGNGVGNYSLNAVTWQIGGQYQIAPNWFLGGSLAYESSNLASTDRSVSGNGQAGLGAVVLKYQTGPWLFAAAGFGGAGQFNTARVITLPGYGAVAKGNPRTANLGLMLRAAYTLGQESLYLRSSLGLSAINARTGSYRESGGGALALSVDAASQTTVTLNPMLELGGRVGLADDLLLRPFVAVGMNLHSTRSWRQTGRLISAPAGSGAFATTVPIDPVAAVVRAGVQLYTGQLMDFRLQYDGAYSGTTTTHAGSLVASMRF